MIRELIILPLVALIIVSFVLQLTAIAESTSAKALAYADGMSNAVDCAFRAKDIAECSPELRGIDFKPDAHEFVKLNQQYLQQLQEVLQNITLNATNGTNQTITIIIHSS